MQSLKITLKGFALFLALSSAVSAAPFTFLYEDTISITSGEFIAGEVSTITIVADNGGTSILSQTWAVSDIVSITFSMNSAPNTITTVFSPVSTQPSSESFVTDGAGILTAVPSALYSFDPATTVLSTNDPEGGASMVWFINGLNGVYYNSANLVSTTNVANNIDAAYWTVTAPAVIPTTPTTPTTPTMSIWGLAILAGLLGLMGFVRRRKV